VLLNDGAGNDTDADCCLQIADAYSVTDAYAGFRLQMLSAEN
jgi:hypothetical protein